MRLLSALGLTLALVAAGGCTDQYGRPDPVGTALLGAAVGAAAGLAVGSATSQPRGNYAYPRGGRGGGGYNRGYGGGYNRGYGGWR